MTGPRSLVRFPKAASSTSSEALLFLPSHHISAALTVKTFTTGPLGLESRMFPKDAGLKCGCVLNAGLAPGLWGSSQTRSSQSSFVGDAMTGLQFDERQKLGRWDLVTRGRFICPCLPLPGNHKVDNLFPTIGSMP